MIKSLAKTRLSLITTCQITFHIICINFQVVFFENSSREFGTFNAVCEEIIKLHIFLVNQGRRIFKKELIHKRRCGNLFCYLLFTFLGSLAIVSRSMIFFSSQTQFFQKNWRLLSLLSIFELLVK